MARFAFTIALALSIVATVPARADDPGAVTYGTAQFDVNTFINNDDFESIERLYAQFLESNARSADGRWLLQTFVRGFSSRARFDTPANLEKFFADWKERYSDSQFRRIAEALVWQERARLAKGGGCYATRPSNSRKAFNVLLERSGGLLREDAERGRNSPLWYLAAINLAGGQSQSASALDALLDEAIDRFPGYWPLYSARMMFLLPEWGGDFARIDAFAREAARRTAADEGKALYAWLYVDLAQYECEQLFTDSNVSWREMKAAFEDMLLRHPAVGNKNLYAAFACHARDVEATTRLLADLGSKASITGWLGGITNESCYRMIRPTTVPGRAS